MREPLAIVVALSENRCIGDAGALPWHIPEDLRHFRRVTTGHAVIMGRRTFESIGRPLPKRRNLVLSRREPAGERPEGYEVFSDLGSAIRAARAGGDPEPRVIGGAAVYAEALPFATRLLLTEVHRRVDGDTFFPFFDRTEWAEISRRALQGEGASFVELERPLGSSSGSVGD